VNEVRWHDSADWLALWHYAREREYLSERKTRLLTIAAARTVRHLFTAPELEAMALLAEVRADLPPSDLTEAWLDNWEEAHYAAEVPINGPHDTPLTRAQISAAWATQMLGNDEYKLGRVLEAVAGVFAEEALERAGLRVDATGQIDGANAWVHPVYREGWDADAGQVISPLIREVVGNPFRPIAFDPSWRTEAVVGLARGMYESRDFAPMPVLADALEDAGCADADILSHCREPGLHVRGCWVVDLVLGKA